MLSNPPTYTFSIGRQYINVIRYFIEYKMRFIFFKFESTTLQISLNYFFIVCEGSQDEAIPKAHDFDNVNEYFSRLLQPSSALTLKKKKTLKTNVQHFSKQNKYIYCLYLFENNRNYKIISPWFKTNVA